MKIPNTPFSTRLSGSAKETELRLRSIFQWKKKRPPVVLIVLVAVVLLGICGGLIGFSSSPRSGTLSEVYPEYFAEDAVVYMIYEDKADQGRPEPLPGSDGLAAAMEYLGNTELRAVWGQKRYIGDFNFRNGAFYLVKEQDVPLKIELYPDGYVVISKGPGQTEDNKDAKVYRSEAFDKEAFMALWVPQNNEPDTKPPQEKTPTVQTTPTEQPTPSIEPQNSPLPGESEAEINGSLLFDSYVTEFPFYVYTGMKLSDHEGRVFTIEDTPKNLAEAAVIEWYGLNWTGGTKKLELCCGNEALTFGSESDYKRYTIHEVSTLTLEDFTVETMPFLEAFIRWLSQDIQKFGLSEYTVVYTDQSWEWTPEQLARGPQLGNGRYERLYLLGKTESSNTWKLYECYWGEYVYNRLLSEEDPF